MKICISFNGRGGSTHHLHQILGTVAYVIPSGGELGSTYYESILEFTQLERGYGQFLNANKKALGFADLTVMLTSKTELRLAA